MMLPRLLPPSLSLPSPLPPLLPCFPIPLTVIKTLLPSFEFIVCAPPSLKDVLGPHSLMSTWVSALESGFFPPPRFHNASLIFYLFLQTEPPVYTTLRTWVPFSFR